MADEGQVTSQQTTDTSGVDILGEIESMIKNHIRTLDSRKEEIKKYKEMLNSALANDATYKLHEEEAKKTSKQKAATKAQILQLPANDSLVKKVRELTGELRETQNALSDYLREYQRLSGSNEIEGEDGEVREIIYVAKLVKRPSKFKK